MEIILQMIHPKIRTHLKHQIRDSIQDRMFLIISKTQIREQIRESRISQMEILYFTRYWMEIQSLTVERGPKRTLMSFWSVQRRDMQLPKVLS